MVVDATAPTTPTGVAAAVENQSVGLSWAASTDTVGVKEYQVYRSATGGFAPSKASKIADVTSGTAYTDAARPAGTWYYRVVAVDAAGNASTVSNLATAVVAGAGELTPSTPAGSTVASASPPPAGGTTTG